MSIISTQKTPDYTPEAMERSVRNHFDALDISKDLAPDIRVLIKPNLLSPRNPNMATTTHPQLVAAVVKWLREHNVKNIVIADSPGGPFTVQTLKIIYNTCGYKGLASHAELNYDVSWKTLQCDPGFKNRSFNIITPIAEADYIINMPKLKTHGMTTMSGAIKNMFGAVPGLQKPELHYKWPELSDFIRMLIELNLLLKPNLAIVDAVEAMEGNGPNSGSKKYTGMTFASRDQFTLDKVMAEFMGLGEIDLIRGYENMGLLQAAELVGDPLPEIEHFKLPDSKPLDFTGFVPKFLRTPARKFFKAVFHPVPKVDASKCIGCGKCAESCPPHIIKITDKKAHFTSKGCISCFCCQEMCPVHAISTKRTIKL